MSLFALLCLQLCDICAVAFRLPPVFAGLHVPEDA